MDPGIIIIPKLSGKRNINTLLSSAQTSLLNEPEQPVQQHRNHAEQDDRHHDPVQAEYLTAVNDQVAESLTCADELSDHHADKTETDIDLHHAQQPAGQFPAA